MQNKYLFRRQYLFLNVHGHPHTPDMRECVGKECRIESDSINQL